ncbi:replication initiation protein [Burkholderia ubonensis]|uniref:replication initiation protein n=1 Tax=Burkholderia ubonensis TaxID=101571 RepID=UPI00075B6786|nr:replication initiation protein [Burkholderia ubonensis]KVP16920.1 replication initiation protein [Burkholderia ubonensis]KVP39956.1 replication initiation protein [Burkholderia ubonensis]
MESASQQMALALFEDLAPRGDSVENAPKDLGFRRSNAFVKIVDLSLAGRRLVDVAYFLVAEDPELRKEYRVDFGLFKWLLATTSNNRRHLTKLIREAQRAAIELNEIDVEDPSKDRWGAVPLMGPAFVTNGEFIFELPERLQRAIKSPKASHFLSLRYVFKSVHSKVLYDRLQPFMEEGVTPWFEVQALRVWLECEKKTYDLFKHFRNKVLDVAINEILEVTGLKVEMLTMNVPGSKRIGQVRFRLVVSQQPNEQKTAFIVLRSLYETLRKEFALNQEEFNEIITNREVYSDERIQQAIEYTRHNVTRGKVKLRAGGYFMKALREGYLLGELDKQIHQRAADADTAQQAALKAASERQEQLRAAAAEREQREVELGWEVYGKLAPEEQIEMVQEFCRSQAAKILARVIKVEPAALREHLDDPRVRTNFGTFMAGRAQKAARAAKQAGTRTATAADLF